VPIDPRTGRKAKPTDPGTWGTFEEAFACYERLKLDGIGFCFSEGGPLAGVDLDLCRGPDTGELDPWASFELAILATYAEVSPSNTGIKAIIVGRLHAGINGGKEKKSDQVEVYAAKHFFTVTGHRLIEFPEVVNQNQPALDDLIRRRFPHWLKTPEPRARAARRAAGWRPDAADEEIVAALRLRFPKFDSLWRGEWQAHYKSASEATLALVQMLVHGVGSDHASIDRLVRASDLVREKWDSPRGQGTWGDLVIGRALEAHARAQAPSLPKPTQSADTAKTKDTHCILSVSTEVFTPTFRASENDIFGLPNKPPADLYREILGLARSVKGHTRYARLNITKLKTLVRWWHGRADVALGHIPFADLWATFLCATGSARQPAGQGKLDRLWAESQSSPPPPEVPATPASATSACGNWSPSAAGSSSTPATGRSSWRSARSRRCSVGGARTPPSCSAGWWETACSAR
jgi:hypothetical protein